MASFAKDVTTPIDIPQVQAPDFNQSKSTAQDVVGLLGFGLQMQQRNQAKQAEEARKATVGLGLEISSKLQDLQGQVSSEKLFLRANQMVRESGGSITRQAEVGAIVAQQFGFGSLGQASLSENEKRANNLEQEQRSLGDFGNLALSEVAPNSTFSELDNDTREKVIEKGLVMQTSAADLANKKQLAEDQLSEGNINAAGTWFKSDKEQAQSLDAIMLPIFNKEINRVTLTNGFSNAEVIQNLQQMKESYVTTFKTLRANLQDKFSADQLLKLNSEQQKQVSPLVKDRLKFYDDKIKFIEEMADDEFKNYGEAATIIKEKDNLDLMRNAPQFLQLKELMGQQAFGTAILNRIATDDKFRRQLMNVQSQAFKSIGFEQDDQFALGVSIMAGIGQGKTIQDYDSEDASGAANVYWATTEQFINTKGSIENSTPEGIASMSIAAVQVLEFAEERGTVEDKQRALKTINSPQFKKLYDAAPPEIKEAMGKKVIQYNRDTFADNAKRLISDQDTKRQETHYNTATGKFEVTRKDTPTDPFDVVVRGRELQAQKARVDALNKQLEVTKIYAKDDPFLSSLSDKEQRDFFVRTAGLPATSIKGKLAEFSQEQSEAESQGITVKELKEITNIETTSEKGAALFADIERQVVDANLTPDQINSAKGRMTDIISGKDKEQQELLSALQNAKSDEEAAAIAVELRKLNTGEQGSSNAK